MYNDELREHEPANSRGEDPRTLRIVMIVTYIHTVVLKYSILSILKILLKIYSYSRSEIRYSSLSILILKV